MLAYPGHAHHSHTHSHPHVGPSNSSPPAAGNTSHDMETLHHTVVSSEHQPSHQETYFRPTSGDLDQDERILWLSLPRNDQSQYYSDSVVSEGSDSLEASPPVMHSQHIYLPAPANLPSSSRHMARGKPPDRAGTSADARLNSANGRPAFPSFRRGHSDATSNRVTTSDTIPPLRRGYSDGTHIIGMRLTGKFSQPFNGTQSGQGSAGTEHSEGVDADQIEDDCEDDAAALGGPTQHDSHSHRAGNRGNKLRRKQGARWARRSKLGGYTEARTDKEMNDRLRLRVSSMQRAAIRSLMASAPWGDADDPEMRSLRQSAEETLPPHFSFSHGLTSTALAPTLLRPIVSPRDLLASHTLRHTFRNPHIGALGKTALDLRESEGVVERAIGRCFAAIERDDASQPRGHEGSSAQHTQHDQSPPSPSKMHGDKGVDAQEQEVADTSTNPGDANRLATAAEGGGEIELLTAGSLSNPAFARLEELFVTPEGLPISYSDIGEDGMTGPDGEGGTTAPSEQRILPASSQRELVRAALECIHELEADSHEYVLRLEEVRSRLADIRRKRAIVWDSLRRWALRRLEDENPSAQTQRSVIAKDPDLEEESKGKGRSKSSKRAR